VNEDFLDLLRELCAVDARFLIVGAYAVSVHAEPRATGDIDIWVEPTPANAELVFEALTAFGAPLSELTVDDLASLNVVFQIGLPPRRIDILTSISGVDFEDAWPNRIETTYGDATVALIGLEELIRNKERVGRPKDLVDLELLRKYRDSDKAGE